MEKSAYQFLVDWYFDNPFSQQRKAFHIVLRKYKKGDYERDSVKKLLKYAKENRKKWTKYESLMNGWLSNWRLSHHNQYTIGPYIADLLLKDVPLVIELDGSQHSMNALYDQRRDEYMKSMGFSILRIQNSEMENKDAVKEKVLSIVDSLRAVERTI